MVKNSIIVTIRKDVSKQIKTELIDSFGSRNIGMYNVYKVRPRTLRVELVDIASQIHTRVVMSADTIFDVNAKTFSKNRYGDLSAFPAELFNLYQPICDIVENKPKFSDLIERYSKDAILRGIFLTDTFGEYQHDVDFLEYQITRFKFRQEITEDIKNQIFEKYPEKLI